MPKQKLVINAEGSETRVALLEQGKLCEYFIERKSSQGITGNIYRGRIDRVLPGMQAAFVDLGPGVERKAYLYVAEILGAGDESKLFAGYDDDDEGKGEDSADAAAEGDDSKPRRKRQRRERPVANKSRRKSNANRKIEDLIKEGQTILVQVTKEPVGDKGARVTGYLSLPGRHCIYMPTLDRIGVSHRISSESERRRLRNVVRDAKPEGSGFIVRTAAEGASDDEVANDVDYLVKLWDEIGKREANSNKAGLLYSDLDIILRSVRDSLRSYVEELIIDDSEQHQRALKFTEAFMPEYSDRVKHYQGRQPIFDAYGIEAEIRSSLSRNVPLKSGGSLVIDHGEALTAIDVNTGSFVGKQNLEDTITKNNLEASKEIARQLRLRNMGGIIVIDFVDMDKMDNRKTVWEEFNKILAKDTTRSNVTKISELGLVEMTRKRTRESLHQMLTDKCPTCEGRGVVKSTPTVGYEVLREVRRVGAAVQADNIQVECVPPVAKWLEQNERDYLDHLEKRFQKKIELHANSSFPPGQYKVEGKILKIEEPGKKGKPTKKRTRGGRTKKKSAEASST